MTSSFPKPVPNAFPADRIIPKSWFFDPDGTPVPYEYRIVLSSAEKNASADVLANAVFTAEIRDILVKHDLLRILGLSALGGHGARRTDTVLFEKTFNDRNIFLEVGVDEIGESEKKEVQTSLWIFVDDQEATVQGDRRLAGAAVSKLLCISGCMCQRLEDAEGY